jgi:hypothetical protein
MMGFLTGAAAEAGAVLLPLAGPVIAPAAGIGFLLCGGINDET